MKNEKCEDLADVKDGFGLICLRERWFEYDVYFAVIYGCERKRCIAGFNKIVAVGH
jgi:hypothetical protein